jgi:fumagillin biosynthesis transferase
MSRYENKTTIQTYYRISAWDPYKIMPLVSPTPVMLISAENDQISLVKNQVKLFEMFDGSKHMEIVPNKTHMDALSGDDFPRVMQLQVDFINKYLE